MIHPIYTYGEDILRKTAKDVDLNNSTLSVLIDDMFETMHNANGAGLAAPQIGMDVRIVVIEEEIREGEIFKIVLINPNILNYSGYLSGMTEGCLSFPGISGYVVRPLTIEVEWYDENKKYQKQFFSGIKARIIQHEVDHLNGTVFIDRIHPEDKMKLFIQLENIKNKKIKTIYPIK
jgi:peptide deformylase